MESERHLLLPLKLSMVAILALWACVWILKPTQLWKRSWHVAEDRVESTFLGETGLNVVVLCFPVLAAAALAYAYLSIISRMGMIRERRVHLMKNFSQPVIINSPFGILSLGELLFMVFFIIFLAWTYYSDISSDFNKMIHSTFLQLNRKQIRMMSLGIRFGSLSEAFLAVLLLPILRRMALLRIVGIQFEASVRYHMWIANGMMFFSLLHGATIMAVWWQKSSLLEQITKWQRVGRVYLAGAITLVTGIIIWITSLPPIRRKYFQFFYATHNLYLVFILFFLLHAGDRHFYLVFSGFLLFSLDKALRLIQSRRAICLLSARLLPCKAVELTLRKPPTLKYTPTSTLFMKIPSISKFQWHPFSIISSSDVDHEQFSIIVKSQGKWTNSLYEMIEFMANKVSDDARSLSVSVEGPYGPANFSYNGFDRLMLIAAGSGITPFISILQDASGRDRSLKLFPKRVLLIYIVKKLHDLSMLTPISTLLLDQTPPIAQNLQLKLKIYVTQEQNSRLSARELITLMTQSKPFILKPIPSGDIMSVPEGLMWNFMITGLASGIFLISILCLTRVFIHEGKKPSKDKTPSWVSDLLVICSLAITTTVIIMTSIISRWRLPSDNYTQFCRMNRNRSTAVESNTLVTQTMQQEHEISFGSRPILTDVLSEEPIESEETKIGVFACGPSSVQVSVASFCKNYSKRTMLRNDGRKHKCSFVYHSINFTL